MLVEFSPEDGYRSDPDFLCQVLEVAIAEALRKEQVMVDPAVEAFDPTSFVGVFASSNDGGGAGFHLSQANQPAAPAVARNKIQATISDELRRDARSFGSCSDFTRSLSEAEDDMGRRGSAARESDTTSDFRQRTRPALAGTKRQHFTPLVTI